MSMSISTPPNADNGQSPAVFRAGELPASSICSLLLPRPSYRRYYRFATTIIVVGGGIIIQGAGSIDLIRGRLQDIRRRHGKRRASIIFR